MVKKTLCQRPGKEQAADGPRLARIRFRAPSTQSLRSLPPCSFPAAAELLTRRPGRASQLGSSFAEATSFATCVWGLLSLLANGDDTLSITADCYSTAAADAALAAALLAYYTSAQVDALLGDYRTGAAQDAETTSAISAALLAYYTSAQVHALLGDYRRSPSQAYRTGPDQDVFATNQITSAPVAYRSAGHGNGLEHRSRAAQLLHHRTSGRSPCRQAHDIAVRFPDDGGRWWPP